jgi:alpha-N-arabinofuranosidase
MPLKEYAISEMSHVLLPLKAANNLYINGALPYNNGKNELVIDKPGTTIRIEKKTDGIYLYLKLSDDLTVKGSKRISSTELGEALVPDAIFESAEGLPILFNTDYFHEKRDGNLNRVGPFNNIRTGENVIKLWPNK